MPEISVTIDKVFTKNGNNTKGPWTKYDVKATDGSKYTTFDDNLGRKAQDAQGQTVEISYHEETRGEYTNRVLDGVKAAGGSVQQAAAQGTAPYQGDDRELRIMRQSGLDRAINTVAAGIVPVEQVSDLFALSDAYIDYFQNGVNAPVEDLKF